MTAENPNSLPKEEAIAKLRQTIKQLENITANLDETSITDLPSSNAIENLVATTTELEKIVPQQSITSEAIPADTTEEISPTETTPLEETGISQESITPQAEVKVVEPIPAETNSTSIDTKPQSSNKKKWIIIGVAAALIIAIIPISWKLFISEKTPGLVARNIPNTPTIFIEPNSDLEIDEPTVDEKELTTDEIKNQDEIIAIPSENMTESEIVLNTEIPSELEREKRPQRVAIETVKPTKELTPEQNLVAAIENKERDLASRYNDELIVAIKPDFTDSILTVILTNDWYELPPNNQNKITQEMLKRSRKLAFNKLQITDSKNNLIARNPVVGDEIVILRRTS